MPRRRPSVPEVRRAAIVGNSHVLTFLEGFRLLRERLPPGLELTFAAQGPKRVGCAIGSASGLEERHPAGTLAELVSELAADDVFLIWRGSQANVRALLLQGPAFDLLLPAEGERVPDPGAELIPVSVFESVMRDTLDRDADLPGLLAAARRGGARVWLLGPPPPLPEAAVRERLEHEPHFKARLREIGVAPAGARIVAEPTRVRLHAVLLDVYRGFARDSGVGFVAPPPGTAGPDGLLPPACWGGDITHGGPRYGAAYLEELLALAA